MSDVSDIPQIFGFVTIKDPVSAPMHGDRLTFNSLLPHLPNHPRFGSLQDWRVFEGLVLAVAVAEPNGDSYSVLGTAVTVAPGVALSAAHVLLEHREQFARKQKSLICIGVGSDGVHAWWVMQATQSDTTDVCILSLRRASELPPSRTLNQATLTTRTPKLGESVLMVGFRGAADRFERRADGAMELEAGMLVSSGSVVQHHARARDSVMMPWPTLEIDGPTIGGMSGGPVFDSRGYLVGIVSSSLDRGPGQEPSPTFASQIWPALGMPFVGGWPTMRGPTETATLLSLGRMCSIERPDSVQTIPSQDGPRKYSVQYARWS